MTAALPYYFLLLPGLGDDAGHHVRTLVATLERFGSVHQLRSVPDLRMAPRTAGTFAALLDLLEPALSATPTAQRVVLVGYSIGGTLAFALADRLARRGRAPHLVIMIDSSAVYPPAALSLAQDVRTELARGLRYIVINLPTMMAIRGGLLRVARAYVRLGNRISPKHINGSRMRLLVRYWVDAITGTTLPDYGGRVLLYKAAKHRPRITAADLGWSRFAATFEMRRMPGDHWTILKQPELYDDLADLLHDRPASGV